MNRTFWMLGCGFALLAVAAGAFGAHALRARLSPDLLAVWETAARYQMYHALALLAVAAAAGRWPRGGWSTAGWLFTAGIVVFSGSLYVLALSGVRWLGAITPIGGVCFLAGWGALALAGARVSPERDAVRPSHVTDGAAAAPGRLAQPVGPQHVESGG